MRLSEDEIDVLLKTMDRNGRKDYVQKKALTEWLNNLGRGTIEAATGVGKTRIGVLAAAKELANNPSAVVYICVPTTTLKEDDWPDEFRKWGHGDLLKKVKIITHAIMPKTIAKSDVDLVVWDECHHATDKSSAFFNNNKVFKILGLSATLPSTTRNEQDLEKREIIDKLCPSVFQVPLEQAIQLELVADFEVKVLKFNLDSVRIYNYGTEEKPLKQTELEHYKHWSKKIAQSMYIHKLKRMKWTFIQKRLDLIMNLPSKARLAKQCMDSILKENERTLIFCGSIDQSIELCGENVYNSQTGTGALDRFQRKEIHYLGVVAALNEGKNIVDLDQSLIAQLNSNSRTLIQRIGRNLRIRPGHKALIVVLVAKDTADEDWFKEAFSVLEPSRVKIYHVKVD